MPRHPLCRLPVPPVVSAASAPAGPRPDPGAGARANAGCRAPPPPPAGIEGAAYPYLVAGPTVGTGTGMSTSAQRKAQEPDSAAAAAAAAASAQEKRRARRRRRAGLRGYGDEFMNMNVEVDPDWGGPPGEEPVVSTVASGQGEGTLGFAGTARGGQGPGGRVDHAGRRRFRRRAVNAYAAGYLEVRPAGTR
jgi:hypothetical protein